MDVQTISAIVFIVVLTIYLVLVRKKLVLQKILFPFLYLILYRSKFGLRFMSNFPRKHPTLVKWLGTIGVVVGFIGMVFISITLVITFSNMLTTPGAPSGVAPVLPIRVRGAVYVPFFYWIISIFVIATVHEFAHGVVSNRYKIPVKSSGFAFFGILLPVIPAAFVEPNEGVLKRKPAWQKLAVFAAGPFSNILLACLFLGVLIVAGLGSNVMYSAAGVEILELEESDRLFDLDKGDVIIGINDIPVHTLYDLQIFLRNQTPYDFVTLNLDRGDVVVELTSHPNNESAGYLGVILQPVISSNGDFYEFVQPAYFWLFGNVHSFPELFPDSSGILQVLIKALGGFGFNVFGLFDWLFLLNIGIGLFNLVPLGIVDGGMMLQIVLLSAFKKNKSMANKIWKFISLGFLFLILFMLVMSFL